LAGSALRVGEWLIEEELPRLQVISACTLILLTLIIVKELNDHIEQINKLCSEHNVRSLFAFGSVVSDNLTDESDIDLIVDIDSQDPIDYSDNYFDLKFQLENTLKRQVDLLEDKAIKNPYLKKQIDNTKVLIYGR
jgi:predicted nucleotidyltransferase